MKKNIFYFFILLVFVVITACNNVSDQSVDKTLFEENPVTIKWANNTSNLVESFQANVQIYSINNRTDTYATLQQTYRLSVKTIDNRTLTRIDFPADEKYGILPRSLISDGKEAVLFDPKTEVIEQRIVLNDDVDDTLYFFKEENSLSRINLKFIQSEANRLLLDVQEDEESGMLILDLPPNLLSKNKYEQLLSSRICFDIKTETVQEVKTVHLKNDGTTVTSTTNILYEEKDGVPIKIGSVTEIESENPNKIEGFYDDTTVFDSMEDIPEISAEDLAKLEENSSVTEKKDIIFGDPGDLSYKESIVELYQDIEINEVDNSVFRILLK